MCAVSHILPYGAARWAVKRTGEGTKNRAQQYKLALRQRVIKFNTCYSKTRSYISKTPSDIFEEKTLQGRRSQSR